MSAVPILQYHSVSDDPPAWAQALSVTPGRFREQLDLLLDAQMSVVPLRRLVSAIRGGPPLPPRALVLTFDDGFSDFYWTVTPLLAERELPATLFVATGTAYPPGGRSSGSRLPPAPMLNWRQVAGLDAYGVEIGGHSRTHAELDVLTGHQLRAEVAGCKQDLEDVLGHPVSSYSYPHGYHSAAVRRTVRAAGWECACATSQAFSSTADDPMRLARITVRHDTTPAEFAAWLRGEGARATPPHAEALGTRLSRLARRVRAARPGPG